MLVRRDEITAEQAGSIDGRAGTVSRKVPEHRVHPRCLSPQTSERHVGLPARPHERRVDSQPMISGLRVWAEAATQSTADYLYGGRWTSRRGDYSSHDLSGGW